ncbi:MAG: hypothetical protein V4572_12120 [Bacteroidota bacterium]
MKRLIIKGIALTMLMLVVGCSNDELENEKTKDPVTEVPTKPNDGKCYGNEVTKIYKTIIEFKSKKGDYYIQFPSSEIIEDHRGGVTYTKDGTVASAIYREEIISITKGKRIERECHLPINPIYTTDRKTKPSPWYSYQAQLITFEYE